MKGLAPAERRQPKPQAFSSLRSKQNQSSTAYDNADLPEQFRQVQSRTQLGGGSLINNNDSCSKAGMQNVIQRTTEHLGDLTGMSVRHVSGGGTSNGATNFGSTVNQQQPPSQQAVSDENISKQVHKKVVSPPKIRDKLMGGGAKQQQRATFNTGITEQGGFILPTGCDDFDAIVTAAGPEQQRNNNAYYIGPEPYDSAEVVSNKQISPLHPEKRAKVIFHEENGSGMTTVFKGSDRRRALLSTERKSSCHVDYSAMKPIQMMSGVSEDLTPQSNSKMMQPKGLQSIPPHETNRHSHEDSTSNELASLPQFRVLTSHYQDHKSIKQVVMSQQIATVDERKLNFAAKAREVQQSQSPSVGNGIIFDSGDQRAEMQQMMLSQKSSNEYNPQPIAGNPPASGMAHNSVVAANDTPAAAPYMEQSQATQYSSVKPINNNNERMIQKTPSASGNASISKGLPTVTRGKKNTSEMDIMNRPSMLLMNRSRGEVTLAEGNDLAESLKISPILPKPHSKVTSATRRQKTSVMSQVSDYNKMALMSFNPDKNLPKHKLGSHVRTPNTELGLDRKDFTEGGRNINKALGSSDEMRNDWINVKRFKTGIEINDRNVTSNGSFQSSNSVRLNQDILSAKINIPEQTAFNADEFTHDKRPSTNKKDQINNETCSALRVKTTEPGKKSKAASGFATVDGDNLIKEDGGPSPLLSNKGNMRKSVLQRNSHLNLLGPTQGPAERASHDVELLKHQQLQSLANTLQGTISTTSKERIRQEMEVASSKAGVKQMVIVESVSSEYKENHKDLSEICEPPQLIGSFVDLSETMRRNDADSKSHFASSEVLICPASSRSEDEKQSLNCTDIAKPVVACQSSAFSNARQQQSGHPTDLHKHLTIKKIGSHTLSKNREKDRADQTFAVYNEQSNPNDSQAALCLRKFSQEQATTSIGEESFIHPPSPIGMHRVNEAQPIPELATKYIISEEALSTELSRIQAKGIHAENLAQIGEEQYQDNISINNDVVDVMHAAVDTQDFLELSGTNSESINGAADHRMQQLTVMGQSGGGGMRRKTKKNLEHNGCGGRNDNELSLTGGSSNAFSLEQLQKVHNTTMNAPPTISCLCKELEQTPEQFAKQMQRYRRQPRMILKSETEKNRVLLITPDGTSKDQQMMECIIHNSMKIDGMSIPKVVAQHHEYFSLLQQMEETTEHKRKRVQMQIPIVNSPTQMIDKRRLSDAGDTLTNRTYERKSLMDRQLAQFVQYGQDTVATIGMKTNDLQQQQQLQQQAQRQTLHVQSTTLLQKKQLQVLHSKCDSNQHLPQQEDLAGLYSPNLMQSQYIDDQSRLVSLNNENQQIFYTGQLQQSTQRGCDISQSIKSSSHRNTDATQLMVQTGSAPYGNQIIATGIKYLNMGGPLPSTGRSCYQGSQTQEPKKFGQNNDENDPHCMSWTKIGKIDDPGTAQLRCIGSEEQVTSVKMIKGMVPSNIEITRPQVMTSQRLGPSAAYEDKPMIQCDLKQQSPKGMQLSQSNQTCYLENQFTKTSDVVIHHTQVNSPKELLKTTEKYQSRTQKAQHQTPQHQQQIYGKADQSALLYEDSSGPMKQFLHSKDPQMSNTSKIINKARSSLSCVNDISTQRRHSNNVSGTQCDEDDISNEVVKAHHSSSVKLTARQSIQGRKSPTVLRGNQRQAGAGGKRTQIGTWTAALCKMTPGQIEVQAQKNQFIKLTVTSSPKNKRAQRRQKSANYKCHSKELQVVRSKQGMLAKISRSIKPAFESCLSNKAIPHYLRQAPTNYEHLEDCNLNDNMHDSVDDSFQKQMKPREPLVRVHRAIQKTFQGGQSSLANQKNTQQTQQPLLEETLMIQSRQTSQNEAYTNIGGVISIGASYQDAKHETTQDIRNSNMFDSQSALSGSDQLQLEKTPVLDARNTDNTIISGNGEATDMAYENKNQQQQQAKQQSINIRQQMRPSSNPFVAQRTTAHSYLQLPHDQQDLRPCLLNSQSKRTSFVDQLNQTHTSFMAQNLQHQKRPQTRQSAVRIPKSSCNPGRGSKVAQKSASLLRINAQNAKSRAKMNRSRQHYLRETFKYQATDNNADQLSVEAIIKDLGNQKSELNLKILKNVERRANFNNGLLQPNGYMPASDYDWHSSNQGESAKNSNIHQAQTATNFFSWTNLRRSTAFPIEGKSTSQFEVATTAENSSSHQNMLLANEWTDVSQVGGNCVPGTSFVPGTNMPMQNQDLMGSDPVQQLVAMSISGKLNHQRGFHSRQANRKQVPSMQNPLPTSADSNNNRARNKERRHKLDHRANDMYYQLCKMQHKRIDVVRDNCQRFRHEDNSHLQSFKQKCGSKNMSPLGRYLEQRNKSHSYKNMRPSTTSY